MFHYGIDSQAGKHIFETQYPIQVSHPEILIYHFFYFTLPPQHWELLLKINAIAKD